MYSSLIGKIQKAKRYAEERERVTLSSLTATFRGDHNSYQISFREGKWLCSCSFFSAHSLCSHTMALQRILEGMIPNDAALRA
jgi:hypothetical protein